MSSTEDIIDGVRRVIEKWTNTTSPLIEDADVDDSVISILSTKRFKIGDEVMLKNPLLYETGFIVSEVIDRNLLRLSRSISSKDWTIDENSVLIKTINNNFIQGVYFGDPEVIPMYPAISVFAPTKNSEWMTLDSTKERHEVDINVYIEDSSQEEGHRFIHRIAKVIQDGLKKNIFPLVGDYQTTSLQADISSADTFIKVEDSSIFDERHSRILIEDSYNATENKVKRIIDENTIELWVASCEDYDKSDTIIIAPSRFIFNSWPSTVDFGKIHKGTLLQAAQIHWFCEEEELQLMRRQDPRLK